MEEAENPVASQEAETEEEVGLQTQPPEEAEDPAPVVVGGKTEMETLQIWQRKWVWRRCGQMRWHQHNKRYWRQTLN
eukprot:1971317-Ditylum_brightwellii.AAC.1